MVFPGVLFDEEPFSDPKEFPKEKEFVWNPLLGAPVAGVCVLAAGPGELPTGCVPPASPGWTSLEGS